MIVLDTHAWLWWAAESKKLSRPARRLIDSSPRVGIAPISCWEIAMLVERRRVTLDRPTLTWLRQALSLPGVELLELSPDVAVSAAGLDGKLHDDPADRLIVATALRHGAKLVTRDERIQESGLVDTVW